MFRTWSFVAAIFILGCQKIEKPTASSLIDKTIQVYGWNIDSVVDIDFDFRDYHYQLMRQPNQFLYRRSTVLDGMRIVDEMSNSSRLVRSQEGALVQLSDSLTQLYSNALNSVLYFFQIPRPLKDAAVISELIGEASILGESYWKIKITFEQNGGGEDFQDEYRYWIHKETYHIDYLAYNYATSGGGTRFRQAIDPQVINGIRFQDYINFKPNTKFPDLDSLSILFEMGELKEISRIENKNINVKKTPLTMR